MKIGDRVGVVKSSTKTEVEFFGYGVYDGMHTPPKELVAKFFGLRSEEINTEEIPSNPRVTLDNGKFVWGCESYWGPEEKIKEFLEGKTITIVEVP